MFDKTKEYENQIEPLIRQLSAICLLQSLPMFVSVAIRDDGETTEYRNQMNGSASQGIRLADDQIVKHVNVANGFDTMPPRTASSFDAFDELEDTL